MEAHLDCAIYGADEEEQTARPETEDHQFDVLAQFQRCKGLLQVHVAIRINKGRAHGPIGEDSVQELCA